MSETRKLYYEDVYTKELLQKFWNAEKVKKDMRSFWIRPLFIRRAADSHVTLVR